MTPLRWRTKFVSAKCDIALALSNGAAGAAYGEAAILISSLLTALSSELWPGRNQDRVRFIELLVRVSPSTPKLTTVSTPLLIQHLLGSNHLAEADQLQVKLLSCDSSLIITGTEVDRSEDDILAISPSIPRDIVRRFSYACLLYDELRSSYAHEYRPGDKAESWPTTMRLNQDISYVNKNSQRTIHFHIGYLARIAIETVQRMDSGSISTPMPTPAIWWSKEFP